MDFKKKLKTRLIVSIIYILLGIALIVTAILTKSEKDFISYYGIALLVMGLARLKKHFVLTKDEKKLKQKEIAENDERNISLINKARSAAFIIYILICAVASLVFFALEMKLIGQVLFASLMLLVIIYWMSYFIVRKKY